MRSGRPSHSRLPAKVTLKPIHSTQAYGAFVNASQFFKQANLDLDTYVGRYAYEVVQGATIGLPEASGNVFLVHLRRRLR